MSGGSERYLADAIGAEQAIGRLRDSQASPILAYGPVLEVFFPASATARDVQHGLGATPTGVLILLESGGAVRGMNVTDWTPDLAFLEADTANTRARVVFILTEVPTDA